MTVIGAETNGHVPPNGGDRIIVVLLGPPASGKGTQGRMLSAALGIPSLSTGDLLRAGIASATNLGRKVEAVVAGGGLVSDDLVNALVARRIRELDCAAGFILDGYPRSVEQAHFLEDSAAEIGFGSPVVLNLKIEVETLMARLAARRYCPECGRTYCDRLPPSILVGHCDDDRALLVRRRDDQPAVIQERMDHYRRLSGPLRDFYRHRSYYEITASASPAMVFQQAVKILATEKPFRSSAQNTISTFSAEGT